MSASRSLLNGGLSVLKNAQTLLGTGLQAVSTHLQTIAKYVTRDDVSLTDQQQAFLEYMRIFFHSLVNLVEQYSQDIAVQPLIVKLNEIVTKRFGYYTTNIQPKLVELSTQHGHEDVSKIIYTISDGKKTYQTWYKSVTEQQSFVVDKTTIAQMVKQAGGVINNIMTSLALCINTGVLSSSNEQLQAISLLTQRYFNDCNPGVTQMQDDLVRWFLHDVCYLLEPKPDAEHGNRVEEILQELPAQGLKDRPAIVDVESKSNHKIRVIRGDLLKSIASHLAETFPNNTTVQQIEQSRPSDMDDTTASEEESCVVVQSIARNNKKNRVVTIAGNTIADPLVNSAEVGAGAASIAVQEKEGQSRLDVILELRRQESNKISWWWCVLAMRFFIKVKVKRKLRNQQPKQIATDNSLDQHNSWQGTTYCALLKSYHYATDQQSMFNNVYDVQNNPVLAVSTPVTQEPSDAHDQPVSHSASYHNIVDQDKVKQSIRAIATLEEALRKESKSCKYSCFAAMFGGRKSYKIVSLQQLRGILEKLSECNNQEETLQSYTDKLTALQQDRKFVAGIVSTRCKTLINKLLIEYYTPTLSFQSANNNTVLSHKPYG